MKRTILVITVLVFCATKILAQQKVCTNCSFLQHVRFKNGVDTIIVLATNKASIKAAPLTKELRAFYHERNFHAREFYFGVYFKPANCDEMFSAPCKDQEGFDVGNNAPNTVVQLRCIVFDKYFGGSTIPYFIVDKITVKQ